MPVKVYSQEEIGEIRIGDVLLPIAFQGMSISGALAIAESSSPGRSGTSKQPLGWEDAVIDLSGVLHDDQDDGGLTAVEKAAILDSLFYARDDKGKPLVYPIANVILSSKGIKFVVIKDCKTDVPGASSLLTCSLTLKQHISSQAKKERKKQAAARAAVADDGLGNGQTVVDWMGNGMSVLVADESSEVAMTGQSIPESTREQSVADSDPFMEFG